MSRPPQFEDTAQALVREIGLHKEIRSNIKELAQLLDKPPSAVDRVLNVMARVGTAKIRFEYDGKSGRKAFYTLLADYAETERRRKEQGIPWSAYQEANLPQNTKYPVPSPTKPMKSFAELAPLRKSEPRAEIEVARKYRDQQAFIKEQTKKFEEMGLDFNPAAIRDPLTPDRKAELDVIVRLLPYIESIETTNQRLEEQNRTIRAPLGELTELRGTVQSQKSQIDRLIAEKAAVRDDVQRVLHEKNDTIKELSDELRRVKGTKAIDGAIGAVLVEEVFGRG